jgi:lipoprotein-anchoring transpeptidase ErfK/SrfK
MHVYRAGRPIATFTVVVGKSSTPTPAGLFAIQEKQSENPGDFMGSWVMPLAAHSNALRSFEGGDGQIGIHGRGGASLLDPLGSAASHGCVRMLNADVDWLAARVPPGTPVRVS